MVTKFLAHVILKRWLPLDLWSLARQEFVTTSVVRVHIFCVKERFLSENMEVTEKVRIFAPASKEVSVCYGTLHRRED